MIKRRISTIIIILLAFLLQTTVFHKLALANVVPNLLLILTVCYSYMRGRTSGEVIGLVCGLMLDMMYGSVIGLYAFIFMTIGRTAWLVSFILGLLFLGFYQGEKQKKHYIRNGLLLVLCICMMFPVTFGMTRYLPPVFHHPVWFWGEWSEERVHSWDAWNSEKYVDIDDVLNICLLYTSPSPRDA